MHSLPIFLTLKGRPVILAGAGPAADAKRRLLERAGAIIVNEDEEARIAFVAIEDDRAAEEVVIRLKARGVLVNAADRPALCDFTLPAIVDRDPVLLAIGTGGASAGLAKHLRMGIEALLPSSLGALAQAIAGARDRVRARWPDADDRRRALDAAFAGALDPLSGADAGSVERWLSDRSESPGPATETILVRSADPDDLTLAEARLLGRADIVFHDPDIPDDILHRIRADAVRISGATAPAEQSAGLTLWLRWKR